MGENQNLKEIVDNFRKSIISSEAEVRSKLIVPLIEYLGYPTEFRAEEFPVYGSEGSKPIKTKHADFILFKSNDFANFRKRTNKNTNWVCDNSLLVFEAKNTDEMPDFMGQPIFYTIWTRAIAYLVTDGISIKGYYYKECTSDIEIIDMIIEDLPKNDLLKYFSYDTLLSLKEKRLQENNNIIKAIKDASNIQDNNSIESSLIINDNDLNGIPDETFNYIRQALGKNSLGLGKVQLISKYLNLTNTFLSNDIRYDIPEYMIGIPRKVFKVLLYLDDNIFPVLEAECTHFYRNDIDIYCIQNNYFIIWVHSSNDIIDDIKFAYSVQNITVSERLEKLNNINSILKSNIINIINSTSTKLLSIRTPKSKEQQDLISKTNIDIASLEALKAIEEYYSIQFELSFVDSENIATLFENIQLISDGINGFHNCTYNIPYDCFNFSPDCSLEVTEPVVLQEGEDIKLEEIELFNIKFTPDTTTVLPGKIKVAKNKRKPISINCCCKYKLSKLQ